MQQQLETTHDVNGSSKNLWLLLPLLLLLRPL